MSHGYGHEYGEAYGGLPPVAENHTDAALDRVLEQYKEQPNLERLLRIFVARWQSLENLLQAILEFHLLDVATGWLLAVYGRLLDLPRRPGWTDDQWRLFLRLKIRALKSSGTADELLAIANIIRDFVGSSGTVRLFPEYPKAYRIELPDVPASLHDITLEILQLATAAPERIVLVFFTTGAGFAFRGPGTTYGFGHGRFGAGRSSGEH